MVDRHQEEDLHYEFKPKLVEEGVVSEVAALANGLGGDLIIGIYHRKDPATGRDQAGGWSNESEQLADKEDHVRNLLRLKLLPSELYGFLEVRVHRVEEGPPQKYVVVINIPPWPHGPAAYRTSVNPDEALYKFPVRVESHTRYCTIEEIMRITEGQRRSWYLRARELFEEGRDDADKRLLVFASPLRARKGPRIGEFPLHHPGGNHATLNAVTSDTIVLTMRGAAGVDLPSAMDGQSAMGAVVDVSPEQQLTIPLDLVRAYGGRVLRSTVCSL